VLVYVLKDSLGPLAKIANVLRIAGDMEIAFKVFVNVLLNGQADPVSSKWIPHHCATHLARMKESV
jgi:hypothetical protein